MASMVGTIFVLVFAQNIEMLMAGGVLCGIPWGGKIEPNMPVSDWCTDRQYSKH